MDVTAIQGSPDATGPETGLLLAVWWLPFRAAYARLARVRERLARRPVSSRSQTKNRSMPAEAPRLLDEQGGSMQPARGALSMDGDRLSRISEGETRRLAERVQCLEAKVGTLSDRVQSLAAKVDRQSDRLCELGAAEKMSSLTSNYLLCRADRTWMHVLGMEAALARAQRGAEVSAREIDRPATPDGCPARPTAASDQAC